MGRKLKNGIASKRKKNNKRPYPSYEWDKLNDIINRDLAYGEEPCEMSEEDYQDFLYRVATGNPDIITED